MKQFTVEMTLTFQTTVTVEANNEQEAIDKCENSKWIDDGLSGAALIDFKMTSRHPKEVK